MDSKILQNIPCFEVFFIRFSLCNRINFTLLNTLEPLRLIFFTRSRFVTKQIQKSKFEFKMEIGLKVTPESLYIEGPYDKQKWTRFALINEQPKNQVFKIKSTRPESISVSPNSGFIKSYERIEILVTLAGDCFDPMVRNREKFLIQSAFTVVPCSAWKETSPREVFKNVAKPSEAKLSLKFLSPMSSKNLEKEIESKSSPMLPMEHQKQPNKQNGKRGNDFHQFQNGFDNSDEVNDGYR